MRNILSIVSLVGAAGFAVNAAAASLPECGDNAAVVGAMLSGKIEAAAATDKGARRCPPSAPRAYTPRHRGVAYDILALESEACFVPDESYRVLDDVIDKILARMAASTHRSGGDRSRRPDRETALRLGRITNEVLAAEGFQLLVPTETIGDALIRRSSANEPLRRNYDCDIGALILMTAAQALSIPAALVDVTLPSGNGHNFVRWTLDDRSPLNWDVNLAGECQWTTPAPSYENRALTRDETLAYELVVRTYLWKRSQDFDRAAQDYQRAIELFPQQPDAYNGFAWMIATTTFASRSNLLPAAIVAAERLVALSPDPEADHLDTLACIYAAAGRFDDASLREESALKVLEEEVAAQEKLAQGAGSTTSEWPKKRAAQLAGNRDVFARRLAGFRAADPRDCLGG